MPLSKIDSDSLNSGAVTTTALASASVTSTILAQPFTSGTAVASTSGTSIDFTSIPSWVKRITVMLRGVSTNGTSIPIIQLGDSGGIETSGYAGSTWLANTANSLHSSGFSLDASHSATYVLEGLVVFSLCDLATNTWVGAFNGGLSSVATALTGAGSKSLSATLDRVRITTVNGTDTFDAGSINIMYEG